MTAHAKRYSPSAAERWMTCPGSVAACLDAPDSTSKYADEGTAAHELAERILRGADGASLVGLDAENGVEFTQDMLGHVMKYVNYVRDLVASTGGTLLIEQKLPLKSLTGEDANGTADAVIVTDDELIIVDLKFGMGVRVDA